MRKSRILLLVAAFILGTINTYAQLAVTATSNTQTLINAIVGQGATVSNITVNCPTGAIGTFTNSGTNLNFPSGVIMTTGKAINAIGPNSVADKTFDHGVVFADPDLVAITSTARYDPCILEFDIIPTCNSLSINFIFGSEEYMEYATGATTINDAFGFFISGPNPGGGNYIQYNIARLPNNTPVTINNVNANVNSAYYVNNGFPSCGFNDTPFQSFCSGSNNAARIQYDGFTVPLTASISVTPCSTYHMKLAIADAIDGRLDSGVFLSSGGLFCQGAQNMAVTFTKNLTCTAPNAGTATANVTGGTPPFTYTWSTTPAQNTQTATGLSAGTYSVTVSDNGCSSATGTVTLTTVGPTITITKTDIPCNGGTTGSATANITGGTAPITIAWSNAVSTAANPNLVAGTYTVTVTDNIGCLAIGSVTIAQASTLAATATSTASTCGATTGTVNVTPSGGTTPYTYTWSNGPTTQSQSNLAAGAYTVTVRDNAGCTTVTSTTVTTPTSFTLSAVSTAGNCTQANSSSVNLTVTGGAAPFTFTWSNGATTEDISNVPAGNYTVTVGDNNGCVGTLTAATTVPTPTTATIANTPANCFGGNSGTATATPTAGGAPYTYLWSNGATTNAITGLIAGTYTVTVTGASGCTVVLSTTVTEPTALTATVASVNPTCTTPNSGTVSTNATGGTAPYTYVWSNGPTTQGQTNLTAGTYTVTVTDSKGCTVVASATLTVPTSFTLALATTNGNCTQANSAAIDLTVTGGLAPFNYAWSNAASTQDLTNIPAGTYTVTVTDANNCLVISAASVTVPTPTTATTAATPVSCFGGTNGTATATPTAGTAPYTYLWSNGASTAAISNLSAGSYTVTVTGTGGCTATATATVAQPAALAVSITPTNPTCPSLTNGTASATPVGGTAPHSYLWSTSAITGAINGLVAGTPYSVTTTDANGCTATATVTLTNPPSVSVAVTTTPEQCNNVNSGTATAAITGGAAPYNAVWSNGFNGLTPTNLAPGTYTVTLTDGNGCSATASGSVAASTLPTVTLAGTNPACNGGSTGSINATGSFASYTWSNGATTNPATNLPSGSYTITVTDVNGCTASASVNLVDPAVLTLSLSPTQLNCNIPNSGAVAATAAGGTAPLAYRWSNNATTSSINNLASGTYKLTVTDAKGCTKIDSVTLATPNPPTLTLNVTPVNCSAPNTAAINAVVTGGTAPITYTWSNGATTANLSNIPAGTYSVTINDATGCTATASTTISAIPILAITVDTINPSCFNGSNGKIDVYGAYTSYAWSQTGLSMPATNLGAGIYTVTVNDNNGCSATRTFNLVAPAALTLTINPTAISCTDPNSGGLQAVVSGGTTAYQYQWSNGATIATLSSLGAGTYSLTITDAKGCKATGSETLTPNPAQSVSLGGDRTICTGDSVVFNLDTITDPIVWHDGSTGTNFTTNSPGLVRVTVNYPNGCIGTDAVAIMVNQKVILYPINDTTLCETETVQLTVGPVGFNYEWSNGTFGPTITVTDSGSYIVTATSNCNTVLDTVTVNIEKCNCEVFIPNAFSPNGDGQNDVFMGYAECEDIQGYSLKVFDRWGNLVFSTTDINIGWDGLMSSQVCLEGVYVWTATYVQAINGRNYEQSKRGSVVLLK